MAKDRGIIKMVFTNFINSFRPRQIRGTFMGEDRFGNKYYEILAGTRNNPIAFDRRTGKSKTSRWFEPTTKDKFDQELSPEWEAWLRGRRKDIPSQQEILKNIAISHMAKSNAEDMEAKEPVRLPPPLPSDGQDVKVEFPKYGEYELTPGAPSPDEKANKS